MTRTPLILAAVAAAPLASPAEVAGQVSWRQSLAEKLAALREGRASWDSWPTRSATTTT